MKLFLASILDSDSSLNDLFLESDFNLQTFYSMNNYKILKIKEFIDIKGNDNFILDSGAFSMFNGSVKNLNYSYLKKYIDRYCDYIIRNNIKNFIEMDIDELIGYDNVIKIREYIKNKTNKNPLIVWHKWRGYDDFIKSCKENEWIFIGIKEKVGKKELYNNIINTAYSYGCKVHILGYTPLYLEDFKNLYSCDSTTWSSGGRYSSIYYFENNKLIQTDKPSYSRRKDDTESYLSLNRHNLTQWIKYQKFLKNKGYKN